MVKRGEVYWVNLDPTVGTEIKKTRPALVVSSDDMNRALPRVIVAPITSKGQALGCRPQINLKGKRGCVCSTGSAASTKPGWQANLKHLISRFGTRY